ncbi:MAG: c-type cytochrome, partial [Verrucomicrobiota bacterium]
TGKLAACFACHKLGDTGVKVGPDLAGIGARLNREQLLESMLEPSKTIAPEFQVWIAQTKSGETISGFVAERGDAEATLRLATGQLRKVKTNELKSMKPQPISLMPEGLVSFLTPQEVADLLAWLTELQ